MERIYRVKAGWKDYDFAEREWSKAMQFIKFAVDNQVDTPDIYISRIDFSPKEETIEEF